MTIEQLVWLMFIVVFVAGDVITYVIAYALRGYRKYGFWPLSGYAELWSYLVDD